MAVYFSILWLPHSGAGQQRALAFAYRSRRIKLKKHQTDFNQLSGVCATIAFFIRHEISNAHRERDTQWAKRLLCECMAAASRTHCVCGCGNPSRPQSASRCIEMRASPFIFPQHMHHEWPPPPLCISENITSVSAYVSNASKKHNGLECALGRTCFIQTIQTSNTRYKCGSTISTELEFYKFCMRWNAICELVWNSYNINVLQNEAVIYAIRMTTCNFIL